MHNEKLAQLNIKQLCEVYKKTNSMDGDHVPTLRGWIMDELERRDAESFNAWMDSDDDLPSRFFK